MQLRQQIEDLVNKKLQAVLRAPLEEKIRIVDLLDGGPAKKTNGTPKRRARVDIDTVVDEILSIVKDNPDGVNSEFLQQQAAQPKGVVLKAMHKLLEAGAVHKTGIKRSTKYFPGGAAKAEPPVQLAMPAPPKGSVPGPNGVIRRKKKRAA
jgi:hypothetical protein